MSEGNEQKVQRGERIAIPASTWNRVIDSIKAFKRNKGRQGPGVLTSTVYPNNTILIRRTGTSFHRSYHVQGIGDPLVNITAPGNNARTRPACAAYNPTSDVDKICILQEPAADGQVVKAVISGFTMAYVRMNEDGHEWANPVNGENGFLESVECGGQARILYKTNPPAGVSVGEGVKFALINLIGAVCCPPDAVTGSDTILGEVTSSSLNSHNVKQLWWNGTDIVPVSPTTTFTSCRSVTQTAIPVGTWVTLSPDPRSPTNYLIAPVWYATSLLGKVDGSSNVKQQTWSGGGITDASPVAYTQCRSTTTDVLPEHCLVSVDLIPDVRGNYWITPAGNATQTLPGFVRIGDQTLGSGHKTFWDQLTINASNLPGRVPLFIYDGLTGGTYISAGSSWVSIDSLGFVIFGGAGVTSSASTNYGLIDANAILRLARVTDDDALPNTYYWSKSFFTDMMPAAKGPGDERWQCGLPAPTGNTVNHLCMYTPNDEWVPFDGTDDGDMLIWNKDGAEGWGILTGSGISGDGTFVLKCVVVGGVRTYGWVNEAGP